MLKEGVVADGQLMLEARPEAGSIARQALMDLIPDYPRLDEVKLALTELINNAVLHAGLAPGQRVAVEMETIPGGFRFTVRHQGQPFSAVAHPPSPAVGTSRGLAIVGRIADRWGVDSGDGEVRSWFEVGREASEADGA
jgi:anti-sigma regulatory factor (Ser/Thr protein kinase)